MAYFCEGRIRVLKRWFKTLIQNAVHRSTVYASLEKKTISWACTAHCSRLLFELKWTGEAFIWRHLNVVICDFAFMLPPESAFCSNHDRKRTFLGCVHAYFARAESAFWNADSKRRSKNAVNGSTVYASLEKKTISWACTAHCSRLLFELKWTGKAFIWRHLNVVICDFAFMLPPESAFCSNHDRKRTFLGVLKRRLFENKHGRNSVFALTTFENADFGLKS